MRKDESLECTEGEDESGTSDDSFQEKVFGGWIEVEDSEDEEEN